MATGWSSEYENKLRLQTEVSRQRILDAAVACVIEYGYSGASTLRIQEAAGVSRGRLLHHFPSKDALLVAAVAHLATAQLKVLETEVPAVAAHARSPERIDEAVDVMWSTFAQPYFWASVQLWVAALHDNGLRDAVADAERDLAGPIDAALAAMFGAVHASHPRFREAVSLLVSSMRGVALTHTWHSPGPDADGNLEAWKLLARAILTGRR